MKTFKFVFINSMIICIFCFSCKKDEPVPEDIDRECRAEVDTIDFTFGINYEDPAPYLIPGEESNLSDVNLEEIRTAIGTPSDDISGVLSVCHWVNQNFTFENAGGSMMGVNTVDELYEIKKFYGCHSAALIISSILREFGFPAVMIETAGVSWAYGYNAGNIQYFSGHVMSEIYVEDKWILLDNNCMYVENYDPLDPYIDLTNQTESHGYFVFAKGIDIWDYYGDSDTFTKDNLLFFSDNIYCFEKYFDTVNYTWKQ